MVCRIHYCLHQCNWYTAFPNCRPSLASFTDVIPVDSVMTVRLETSSLSIHCICGLPSVNALHYFFHISFLLGRVEIQLPWSSLIYSGPWNWLTWSTLGHAVASFHSIQLHGPCIQTSWCLFVGCRSPRAVWHFSFLELHHCLCMCNLLMLSILLMLLLLGWSGYVANLLCVPSTCGLSSLLDLILSGLIFLCLTHLTLYSLVLVSVLVVVVLVLEWRPVDLEF